MHDAFSYGRRPLLTRHWYDPDEEQFTIVADVGPATLDDLRVLVNPRLVRLEIESDRTATSRSYRPPTEGARFADERRAILHNGVLDVTVGVVESGRSAVDSGRKRP